MKSGQRETLDRLDRFLKKPNSFNINELSYLSHGTWEQLKKRPDLVDIVFNYFSVSGFSITYYPCLLKSYNATT